MKNSLIVVVITLLVVVYREEVKEALNRFMNRPNPEDPNPKEPEVQSLSDEDIRLRVKAYFNHKGLSKRDEMARAIHAETVDTAKFFTAEAMEALTQMGVEASRAKAELVKYVNAWAKSKRYPTISYA